MRTRMRVVTRALVAAGVAALAIASTPAQLPADAAAGLAAAAPAVRDVEGRPILPQPGARIVSVAPAQTEILFAIGAGGAVRAVSDYCNFPAAARKLPKVGSLTTLSIEKVISFKPTLIVTAAGSIDQWRNLQRLSGAVVFTSEDGGIPALRRNLAALGYITGRVAAARNLDGRIARKLAELATANRSRPSPKVFYMVWDDPLITAGRGSYADDLIRAAGGRNVATEERGRGHQTLPGGFYPRMSWETLVAHPPEVFLGARNLRAAVEGASRKVHAPRTAVLDEDIVSRPGPRVLDALDLFVSAIHGIAKPTGNGKSARSKTHF